MSGGHFSRRGRGRGCDEAREGLAGCGRRGATQEHRRGEGPRPLNAPGSLVAAPSLLIGGVATGLDQPGQSGFRADYSTVTDFARLRGWSTSVPLAIAV